MGLVLFVCTIAVVIQGEVGNLVTWDYRITLIIHNLSLQEWYDTKQDPLNKCIYVYTIVMTSS